MVFVYARAEEEEVEVQESLVGYVMGLTMVGTLMLTMGLWYLVHSRDVDIRKTTWDLISNTTSIFCAVLIYSFSSKLLTFVFGDSDPDPSSRYQFEVARYMNQAEVVFWYGVLFGSIAWKSGLHKTLVERTERMKDPTTKNSLAVTLLWAHVVAFAGIAGWGMVQTSHFRHYRDSPMNAALLIPEAFLKWFIILWVLSVLRRIFLEKFVDAELKADGTKKWDKSVKLFLEKLEDGEHDIYGLFVSFLIVQSLRFAISGVLPNAKGAEEGPVAWSHSVGEIVALYLAAVGILLFVCCMPFVLKFIPNPTFQLNHTTDNMLLNVVVLELKRVYSRLQDIVMNISAMSFAWCFMYATQWAIASSGLAMRDESALKILLAATVTVFCFFLIFLLDSVADRLESFVSDDEHVTMAATTASNFAREMMRSVGFLVGFSWEAAFDTAIEGITEEVPPQFRTLATSVIGIGCVAAILPAWWYYIVPMVEEGGYHLGFIPRHTVDKANSSICKDRKQRMKLTKALSAIAKGTGCDGYNELPEGEEEGESSEESEE
eukprot:TRINITY_DN28059_c0_g1_i1.p1 TRINITY_DN28059_c0_g1~~TRINITY_DN28059_c0_g1_i1.p1  ORF type:complete len:576 (-),score=101.07 TRINITY_DN28059_c0_g1_i1:156-1793(-)